MADVKVVRFNVGGVRRFCLHDFEAACLPKYDVCHDQRLFATSSTTLKVGGDSFFSVLLSGRMESVRDETGAYFIDRECNKRFAYGMRYIHVILLVGNALIDAYIALQGEWRSLPYILAQCGFCFISCETEHACVCMCMYFVGICAGLSGSPKHFDTILQFLRTGELEKLLLDTDRTQLIKEAEFYGLETVKKALQDQAAEDEKSLVVAGLNPPWIGF